jgi:hypothetical protein
MAWRHVLFLILASLQFTTNAQTEDKEPTAIVELGAAGEWGLPGASSYGPSLAVEFTPVKDWLDFMFWPTADRKYGWFLEPAYSYSFNRGHDQSLSTTVGLLVPIP